MSTWRVIPNFPLYEINRGGTVKQVLDGRKILPSGQNGTGVRYHLESKSGRVVSMKKADLVNWAFPKDVA